MRSNILCARHNNALSPLDTEAGRFIRTFGEYDANFNTSQPVPQIAVFSGEDIERWMLKTVCGMVAAGQVAKDGIVQSRAVPDVWVDVLYRLASWPTGWGVYLAPPAVTYHSRSFSFVPKMHPLTGQVLAAEMEFNGFRFVLLLGKPDNPTAWGVQRPRMLVFEQRGVRKFIELSWSGSSHDEYVVFSRAQPYDGWPPDWPVWAHA